MSIRTICCLAIALMSVETAVFADDGALDPTFGSAGKVQLSPAVPSSTSFAAADVAVQADGKIVIAGVASNTSPSASWLVCRLNANGSLDTTFQQPNQTTGCLYPFSGLDATTQADAVAVRPDGHIVVAGTLLSPFVRNTYTSILVVQLNTDGSFDQTFGTQGRYAINPSAATDSVSVSRLLIESDGSIDLAGTYFNNQSGFNGNQFFFDRIAADGSSSEPFAYQFGSGPNQDDHALDLAVDSQGRYVVVGYHRGAMGNYDCAVIRIRQDLFDVDQTFGSAGQTTVAFDLGGDNGDFCSAVALLPNRSHIVIGGHSTIAASGGGTYLTAVVALLDDNGGVHVYVSGSRHVAKFDFPYDLNPAAGENNTITKLIIDNADSENPQLLAMGTGYQNGPPIGPMFGIARLNLPSDSSNFTFDNTLNGKGVEGVYFFEHPPTSVERSDAVFVMATTNTGLSAAYANGKLIVAGSTDIGSGNAVAVTRLAPFDRIFANGLDIPSI